MPCYTPPHQVCTHDEDDISNKSCDISQKAAALERTAKYYKEKSDQAVDMLCRIMSEAVIVGSGKMVLDISDIDDDIQQWWEEHKKFDAARKK